MINIFFYITQYLYFFSCACFLWAGIFFFKKPLKKNLKFMLINFFGLLAIILNVIYVFNSGKDGFIILGFIFLILSLLFFWLAIFECKQQIMRFAFHDNQSHQSFIITGPYRYVRHPFYLSYSLTWFSGVLITEKCFVLLPIFLIMISLYYIAAKEEEKSFYNSSLCEEYKEYAKNTFMFLPKIY